RSLFSWWNIKVGGEVFYSIAKSNVKDFKIDEDKGWSGKIEANTSWMLNRQKTLIFNVNFTHYFPYRERMVNYEAFSLFGCDLRYSLLDNRLNLTLSVREPFGWNITKSKTFYQDYILYSRNNVHSHSVSLRISYSFGGNKVNNVYRDTKERESSRTY
ncbi:MAG: outer membrane beta-barrel protein, partial [Muribaculaceae bacterium]|nr:outer membrane beta-barrel protein [Muribaculaceae bacterium]